ncbi:MAG: tetratricopeptide repeat protein [Rhodospirillaceae bacterium]|nr:tetratricopeptide repeat protein [Rhodospirillales bacterium]
MRTAWDHIEIGLRFLKRGDLPAAEAVFRAATAADPHCVEAWYNLAWTLDEQGRYREAGEAVMRAVELDTDWPDAKANLERCRVLAELAG